MTHYTILNDAAIKIIFDQYEIGEILEYKILSGGSENTNYRIKSSEGQYVLTICEQKTEDEANNLARLLLHLNSHGFATSGIVENKKGTWLAHFKDKPLLLKTYIKGIITPHFSNQQMETLGSDLAALHNIPAPEFVPESLGYGIEQFTQVEVHAPDTSFCKWLKETTAYIRSFLQDDLPRTLIHSDLFYNNVITNPETGQVTIMDLEEAAFYYRIYDIGMTLVGTCTFNEELHLGKSEHLLKAYQHKNPLTENEKKALQAFTVYAATATAFWRYMNFNFVRPNEAKKDSYKEMQGIAMQVMEIPVEDFLSICV